MLNIVYENSADRVALWDPHHFANLFVHKSGRRLLLLTTKLSLKPMDHTPTPRSLKFQTVLQLAKGKRTKLYGFSKQEYFIDFI